jgi:Cu(I)-responsive transcriptional regulator
MDPMNIGDAAKASGVSAKMIRHYESIGLLEQAMRTHSGYRQYVDRDLGTLRFIRHARDLGFSLDQIRELLSLWQNRRRPSRQVKLLAEAHIHELDAKLREFQAMKSTLEHLARSCHGDDRPECPILDSLAEPALVAPARRRSASAGGRVGLRSGK